ncbi:hypothetical protein CPHO_11535 [Corynebacterium phocae]|uniref:Uncharacterized protein n=1 Tax=Corynebacterium phocae TaxID=161895 RepID=A0A1L7D5H1_9CORY|nr:YncE family protein [Corynebacterium phocae]APT93416.1 hypothetical protein CPHO_11535 [Corynebacterium phocae]KAA8721109.1 YncE family protein [Corynebacterium phocae]
MKKTLKPHASSRAIGGLLSAALVASGLGVVSAVPALAETTECANFEAKPAKGLEGTYSIKDADSKNFASGDTISVTGVNVPPREGGSIAFKLDFGGVTWPDDQNDNLSAGAGGTALILPAENFADGNLNIDLVLPEGLQDGKHVLNILVGNDGQDPRGGQHIEFLVDSAQTNDGHCGTIAAPAATVAEASVSKVTGHAIDHRKGNLAGDVVVEASASGLAAGAALTISIDGVPIKFSEAPTSGPEGTYKGKVTIPKGAALAGEHTLTVSDGTTSADAAFSTGVYAAISHAGAQGATATANVTNLPAGSNVTAVGVAGNSWWTGTQAAMADGSVTLSDVEIPADAPFGQPIVITYTIGGETKTVETGTKVSATVAPENVDHYDVKSVNLGDGLYQTAINNDTNEIFVTRSNRTKYSTLYKLDATTLEVKQEVNLEGNPKLDNEILAAYGIGLDKKRDWIWVTNSRQNTIAAYNQKDLSLVKQWPKNFVGHPRDIVIDEKTGKAWISSVFNKTDDPTKFDRGNGNVVVVDYDGKSNKEIDLGQFPVPMSLELDVDSNYLYTVSRNSPKIARINTTTEEVDIFDMPADKVDGGAGVALDTKHNKLYIAATGSGNTLVFNAADGSFQKEIRTGAGAISARYNPVDERVYVGHRDASTVVAIDSNTDEIVARFDSGVWFNHVNVGADGTVYAVDKSSQNPASADRDHDHLFAFKLKEEIPGKPGAPGDNDQSSNQTSGSSNGKDEKTPEWLVPVLSVGGVLAFLGLLAAALPMIAKHLGINLEQFGIRLPF